MGAADRRGAALVVLVALLSYGAACVGTFVYDDHHSVRENVAIQSLLNVPSYFVDVDMFSRLDNRMYRPVLLCSFAINHAIGGVEPWIYKLTNVLIHAGTAVLLFGLARRLGAARTGAVVGAALFAAHPLASEAVNMISGRSELLLVAALVGGMHCHMSAMDGRRLAHVGTVLCAIAACGSKETGVILPVLLAVLEGLRAMRTRWDWRAIAVRLLPAATVVVAYLIVRDVLFGVATTSVRWQGGSDPNTGHGRDMITQLSTMATVLPRTLGQAIVPAGLSLDPTVEFIERPWRLDVAAGALLLVALTFFGLRRPTENPARVVGTCIAWGTALPWVLIPLNVPLSEHRLYGPLLGLGLVVAAVWPSGLPLHAWRRVAVAAAVVLFGVISAERSAAYRDEKILWQRVHAGQPESYRACYGIGVLLMKEGELADARGWMTKALDRYPDYVSARKNLAEIELQLGDAGDPAVALEQARWLVERPSVPDPFDLLLLSRALTAVGDRTGEAVFFDEAVERALQCEEVASAKGLMYRTAAHARRVQGRLDDALRLLDESIARGLDHSSVRLDRVLVLAALGRDDEAEQELHRAMSQDPFDPHVIQQMQQFAQRRDRPDSAGAGESAARPR